MKRKILCLLLVLVMCLTLVVACNKDNGDGNGNGDGSGSGSGDGSGSGSGSGGGVNRPGGSGSGSGSGETAWWEDITYDETTLRFQMTKCSNNEELPSGCERYLAGEDHQGEDIDDYVAERNDDALNNTNIKEVIYTYYDDTASKYGYSKCIDIMYEAVMDPDSKTPDMFCNWMTDMLCTSLKGTLANLYSKTRGEGDQYGKNYFDLEDPGYMSELMGSLTLSQEKIYVVASDYFLDLIRAFFVVPVNVNLYNGIAKDMIEDLNEDGAKDINDFFIEVQNGDWTYARLAEYCQKVYVDTNSDIQGKDIKDTMGFLLGRNGLPAAGLVYTSSVVVINKVLNESKTDYNYYYDEENQGLFDLTDAIYNLMQQRGVMCVDSTDAAQVEVTQDGAALLSVRKQFTSNKCLFGGIILVGSLEYSAYQGMKTGDDGGFGVVPVPVYKDGDTYLTQIHVVGRAGGIAHSTTKYAQCTAFLHYQSSHSTDILNEYYDYNLTYDIADNLDGNVEMLEYIRDNVRTSFDKLFEDAIGFFYETSDPDAVKNRWHTLICDNDYEMTSMRNTYTSLVGNKNTNLGFLVTQYKALPD